MSDVLYQFDDLYVLYCKYKRKEKIFKSELIKSLREGHRLNEDYLSHEDFMLFMADCIEDEKPIFDHPRNSKRLTSADKFILISSIAYYKLEGVRGALSKAIRDLSEQKGCDERTIRNDMKRLKEDENYDVIDYAENVYQAWKSRRENSD